MDELNLSPCQKDIPLHKKICYDKLKYHDGKRMFPSGRRNSEIIVPPTANTAASDQVPFSYLLNLYKQPELFFVVIRKITAPGNAIVSDACGVMILT